MAGSSQEISDQRASAEFLMPFGDLKPKALLDAQHYAALHRGYAKLKTLQKGRGFVPAGPCYALVRRDLARSAILAIPFSVFAIGFWALGSNTLAWAFGLIVLIVLGTLAASLRAATPRSPQAAIQTFYALIASGSFGEAFDRVVRCDRDDSLARANDVPTLGDVGSAAAHLDEQNFSEYWKALLYVQSAPWVQIRTHNFKSTVVGVGLTGVDFDIEIIIRSGNWLWLILLGILPGYALALILSYWTSTRVRGHLHKLVCEMAGEHQLFNGEFQGAEEFDLSWLPKSGMR